MHVLLAEDDFALGRALQVGLMIEGMTVDWARDGIDAYSAFQKHNYDVLVLDLGLPGIGGIDLLTRIRQSDSFVPIVIVSARGAIGDRINGLDRGADDYLAKPFEIVELVARLRAVVRRVGGDPVYRIRIGDVEVDLPSHTVSLGGTPVSLTQREFAALRLLIESPGTVSKAQILGVIGNDSEGTDNVVMICIHNLRRKLGRDFIRTYRGWGYRIRR